MDVKSWDTERVGTWLEESGLKTFTEKQVQVYEIIQCIAVVTVILATLIYRLIYDPMEYRKDKKAVSFY